MEVDELRRKIFQTFTKTHGLSLHTEARKYLESEIDKQGRISSKLVETMIGRVAVSCSNDMGKPTNSPMNMVTLSILF